jgi:two-component system chemotaxis sensor kinase CheA
MSQYDLNQDELLATFLAETQEDISALEESLLALESAPEDRELRLELLRRAHTIKGNASCVGFDALASFAHMYEERLENSGDVDAALIASLLDGIDTFRRLLSVEKDRDGRGRPSPHRSDPAFDSEPPLGSDRALDSDPALGSRDTVASGEDQCGDGRPRPSRSRENQHDRASSHVRVAAEKLDRMLDLAGEIAIARGRVRQLLDVRPLALDAIVEVERQSDLLQSELQELIMRARMVPIGPTFRQYARTVRDLAAAHGKNARLITIGEDVELDKSAVELLRDPLTHMIRNAIDHGLETSAERVANGKSAVGHITLEARHEAGMILIRVSDDGAGLDRNAIASRARALGIESEGERAIFAPGFTTAQDITDLSGRGVGMDVVLRAVDSLRGTIHLSSADGLGTTFSIRLPLTLAVIDGFAVSAGNETYVVPMENVVECVELSDEERAGGMFGVKLLRGEVVPYVRLRQLFGNDSEKPPRENLLIVQLPLEQGGAVAGLAVDELHGSLQAVIKPLDGCFRGASGISASSILGDGRVALILDTPAILRSLSGRASQ